MNQPPPFVPLKAPTFRANQSSVAFDMGAFVVSLMENRPLAPNDGAPSSNHLVEVGRFAMPPGWLLWLRENINNAIAEYERAIGHPLPDPAKMGANLASSAAESLLKPPPGTDYQS